MSEDKLSNVVFRTLGECFEQFSGMSGVSDKWAKEGNCRFIDYMNVYTNLSVDVDKKPFATVKSSKQNTLKRGDILFTCASEVPDECALSAVIEDDIEDGIFLDDHLFGLRIKEEYKDSIDCAFLKYEFRSPAFRKQVRKVVRGVTRFYISKPDFMKIKIPIPPIEVQRDISGSLNSFTKLEEELEAELSRRKMQYEYYRDCLLDFERERESRLRFVTLADYGVLFAGLTGKDKNDFTGGNATFVSYINVFNNIAVDLSKDDRVKVGEHEKQHSLDYGDIVFTGSSETLEECGMSSVVTQKPSKPIYLNSFCFFLRPYDNSILLPEFSKFLFRSNFIRRQIRKASNGVTRYNVSKERMKKIIIPIPDIEYQKRVVDALNAFEHLTTRILPAEIEARHSQYIFYRDKLLSF